MIAALAIILISAALISYLLWEHRKTPNHPHLPNGSTQADEIITQAEVEAIKIAEEAKLGTAVFTKKYNDQLTANLNQALVEFKSYLDSLKQQSSTNQTQMEQVFKDSVNQMLFKLEQNLAQFLVTSQQKSLESINLELKSARNLIDTYKQEQLQLIDENIIAVLERTLSLVMSKKLTLSDQLDLVYEALEKAKVEKFFA